MRRWLEERAHIEPSLLEGAGLDAAVAGRIAQFGGAEPAYVEALSRVPEEADRLLADIAVPETWFFRYPRSYDLLLGFLESLRASGEPALRMLSIGCATGQEPYGMAITALHAGWPADRVTVEALDRNSGFLRVATKGEYGASSIRTEAPAWAMPFLQRKGDMIVVAPPVRGLVRFTRADVSDPASLRGAGPFHVVFCRNLLIYLNSQARTSLLDSICAELAPDGLLFVGHAEQGLRGASPLRAVSASHAFALQPHQPGEGQETPPAPARRSPARSQHLHDRPTAPLAALTPAVQPHEPSPAHEESLDIARGLADTGRIEDSEAMIRAVIARRGPSAEACELLGMIRLSVNDDAGAKRLFEQSVYLDPSRAASLLQLAMISERSGDSRRAGAYWDRARRASAPQPGEGPR